MNELIFRGKDRFIPDAGDIALLLMLIAVEVLAGQLKFHWGAGTTALLVGATLLPIVVARVIALRSWVRVDADGITVNRGLGRGRTYPWQQISWVDVSEIPGRTTTTRVARIHTTDGRRHWLSTLVTSDHHPAESFDADVRRVVDRWKQSTEPDRRIRPGKQFRDRITPMKIGFAAAAVLGIVLGVLAALG
ncbi:PH domain-containing protein [Kitasatospora sp. NPDC089797]|uniref:PH domain-containing protein n=1 Tax=Kitasatospora sp. NPDC089797 TaxID=3155298 RepID=UPI0034499B1C